MFLGRIPNPQTGKPEINLEIARMFIDQLEMIHEKTRGNLTSEESEILSRVLSDLQLTFVQASGTTAPAAAPAASAEPAEPAAPAAPAESAASAPNIASEPAPDSESKKKFSKSYGN